VNIGIDLDGTIHKSNILIPGTLEAISNFIIKHNIFFITNNSSRTPKYILNKLNKMLDIKIELDNLITPLLVAEYVLRGIEEELFIHGSKTMKKYMHTNNFSISNSLHESQILLIGRKGSYTKKDIEMYTNFYKSKKKIYAFNKDMTFPTEKGFAIGNGVFISELEDELNVTIPSFGKPDDAYIQYINSKNVKLDFVIGDRIDTDMKLGEKLGATCVLVETGVYNSTCDIPKDLSINIFRDLKDFSLSI